MRTRKMRMSAFMRTDAMPEKALLSQVVLLAISDGCAPPPKPSKKLEGVTSRDGIMMQTHAFTAMRFLFDTTVAGLQQYSLWLDFDADRFRSKLLTLMANDSPNQLGQYSSMQRRAFRINYKLWRMMHDVEVSITEENDDA